MTSQLHILWIMRRTEQQRELSLAQVDRLETDYLAATSTMERRSIGATFTPQWIVDMMLRRVPSSRFSTVIDAGAGPGRFTVAAAHRLPHARIVAIETNAALVSGLRRLAHGIWAEDRVSVLHGDFLECPLPRTSRRLFLGNPPYVRHHVLSARQKEWLRQAGTQLNQPLSTLSGLHVYFLARFLMEARDGDALLMILPSEWLETRYGSAIKAAMLERCSSIRLLLFDSRTQVFDDAMTTSVILQLKFGGSTRALDLTVVDDQLGAGQRRATVMLPPTGGESANWLTLASNALNPARRSQLAGNATIELGEVFEIHRGQVTGKNNVWIATPQTESLVPKQFLYPCVTDAREILALEEGVLASSHSLRKVIDLPRDLAVAESRDRELIESFLRWAQRAGAADGYIARHRRPWWKVGLKSPPAVIMTYMARRAPRFAVNQAGARLINIAHGLYPRGELTVSQLHAIVRWLNTNALGRNGRTYAGGLIKLEPGDAARIRIPEPRTLELAA